ncbi:hypothetical protein NliqN6_2478 [Naganishia liquefaciens]|uniref:Uncharacterized protein n=1 Tax=Naganishia liquefaciens TaxID=104408 RepID=A0A8H3TSB5_9TREE|nr:hypothetical protein NliqN6_2478 [Naganishia liquefaciens]
MADPYLDYRPSFAYSLPVQLLIQGITLTLLVVLLIHLLFTTQYHFPLSRFNYLLQLAGILLVLTNIIISIVATMRVQDKASQKWPYMLDYISVNLPNYDWSTAETAAWFTLHCACNGLVQLTHIQFLTLLFPSKTEVQLIFLLLGTSNTHRACLLKTNAMPYFTGPLAVAASGLVYTSLSTRRTTIDLGDAIRNVFDSTLLLIFSMALFIWGFLVNRKRAWRTDGGTGAFGAGAMALAITSTAVNFVEVREDHLSWLQNLTWALVLWQSWLGFWWWVGSGMGIGEVQDIMEREERRKIRQERRERKRQREAEAARQSASVQDGGTGTALSSARGERATGTFATITQRITSRATRRRREQSQGEEIEMQPMSSNEREDEMQAAARPSTRTPNPQHRVRRERTFVTESTSSDASPLPLESVSGVFAYPINAILRYVRYLRSGHEQATKAKVEKRAHLRRKVFESESRRISANDPPAAEEDGTAEPSARNIAALPGSTENVGWGLGSFGIREAAEGERRLTHAQLNLHRDRFVQPDMGAEDSESEDGVKIGDTDVDDIGMSDIDVERGEGPAQASGSRPAPRTRSRSRSPTDRGSGRHIRMASSVSIMQRERRRSQEDARARRDDSPAAPPRDEGASWYWWKPLRKWRMTDKSVY